MPIRIVAATLLCAFTVASCRTWTPLEAIPDPVPDMLRVELLSGEQVGVRGGRIEADTLVGRWFGGTAPIRVAVDQIASIEAGVDRGGGTAVLVLGIGVIGLSALIAVAFPLGGGTSRR